MAVLRLCVFGGLTAHIGRERVSVGGAQQGALLACLIVNRSGALSTERLVDALWPEASPMAAAKTVQVYVSRLRQALGESAIVREGGGYVLRDDIEIDSAVFERAVQQGQRSLAAGDTKAAGDAFATASAIARAEPYAGLDGYAFLEPERRRLDELRWQAIEGSIDARLAAGRHAEVLAELRGLVETDPLREQLWAQLMVALYRSGRQSEALEAYHRARRELDDELGVEPGPELQDLQVRILQHDRSLEIAAPARSVPGPGAPGQAAAVAGTSAPRRRWLAGGRARDHRLVTLLAVALLALGMVALATAGGSGPGSVGDGRLAYARYVGSGTELHTVDADGERDVRISTASDPHGPSWSPDGRRLVYADSSALWLTGPEGDDQDRIVLPLEGRDLWDPAWSPDGTEIAFVIRPVDEDGRSLERYRLGLVRPDGTGYRELDLGTPHGYCDFDPAWSPDSRYLLFVRSEEECGNGHVWIADRDGSGAHPLLRQPLLSEFEPHWSGASDRIAFWALFQDDPRLEPTSRLALTDPGGGSIELLIDRPRGTGPLTWSPDGSRIAFMGVTMGIAIIDVSSGEVGLIGSAGDAMGGLDWGPPASGGATARAMPPPPATPSGGPEQRFVERTELAGLGWISSETGGGHDAHEIQLVASDGTSVRRIILPGMEPPCCYGPTLSPDGEWVAFTDAPANPFSPVELWIARIDGSEARLVVRPAADGESGPWASGAWSPDGRTLAFTLVRRAAADSGRSWDYGIATVPVAGGGIVELTDSRLTKSLGPSWSSDGRRIAFQRHDRLASGSPEVALWEVDVETREERPLIDLPERDEFGPAWSPDGSRLAFTGMLVGSDRLDVFSVTADGQVVTQLTRDGVSGAPVWSPDGAWIAYSRTGSQGGALVMRSDGTDAGRLMRDPTVNDVRPVSWARQAEEAP